MRITLTLFLVFCYLICFSQVTEHVVEPVGIYKEIDIVSTNRIVKLLVDSNTNITVRAKLIDSIEQNPNVYIPPVLYVLSYEVFNSGNKADGMFWFYLAQLRARYDVNRCADKTANASEYNMTFGPPINDYAFKHIDILTKVVDKVIAFEKANEESYDPRWINLSGMGAMTQSLGGKSDQTELSLPKNKWAEIRSKTINNYFSSFEEYLASLKKKQ